MEAVSLFEQSHNNAAIGMGHTPRELRHPKCSAPKQMTSYPLRWAPKSLVSNDGGPSVISLRFVLRGRGVQEEFIRFPFLCFRIYRTKLNIFLQILPTHTPPPKETPVSPTQCQTPWSSVFSKLIHRMFITFLVRMEREVGSLPRPQNLVTGRHHEPLLYNQ
jgi:hypothetical protein